MKTDKDSTIILRVIQELGYENLDSLIKISQKSPSTMMLVMEKILKEKTELILLIDSQQNAEAQHKRLAELEEKDFHRPSFTNGWNECLGFLKSCHLIQPTNEQTRLWQTRKQLNHS